MRTGRSGRHQGAEVAAHVRPHVEDSRRVGELGLAAGEALL